MYSNKEEGPFMKRLLALTMTAVMLLSSSVFAQTNIIYDGKAVEYSTQEPVIIDEHTYVPIRDVFESIGFKVNWDNENKIAEIDNDYYYTLVNTNNDVVFIMNKAMEMKAFKLNEDIKLINGRTMLPLREIVEAMGYEIEWDAETKSSIINDNNDYDYLRSEYDKFESAFTDTNYNYEVDESKPVGSFSEEELAYLNAVNTVFESIEDMNDAESVAVLSSKLAELSAVKCPESLKDFNTALTDGLKTSGVYLLNGYNCLELFTEDSEISSDSSVGFSIKLIIAAKVVSELKPATNILYDICAERNIDPNSIGELLES
jgi:hypothetical protein